MNKFSLVLVLFLLVLGSGLSGKDEILFEAVLKDAVFMPLYVSDNQFERVVPSWGWWTLKFENGAVISFYRGSALLPKNDIWWTGKTYVVSKKGFGENNLFVKLRNAEE